MFAFTIMNRKGKDLRGTLRKLSSKQSHVTISPHVSRLALGPYST